jgi:hypothetical protein
MAVQRDAAAHLPGLESAIEPGVMRLEGYQDAPAKLWAMHSLVAASDSKPSPWCLTCGVAAVVAHKLMLALSFYCLAEQLESGDSRPADVSGLVDSASVAKGLVLMFDVGVLFGCCPAI